MCYDPLTLPFVLLIHPITFVHKGLMHNKGCPMDSFNVAFGPTCPFLVFVHKGIMESKVFFMTPLTLPLVLLVHPITFVH